MNTHLFYVKNVVSEVVLFDDEISKHCKVIRLKPGDTVFITDGRGTLYKAVISENQNYIYQARITESLKEFHRRTFRLHIAISPTKNPERFEWFVEKATENGIDEITPLYCARTERVRIKPHRLQKIAESAMEQSFSAYLPAVNEGTSFEAFLKEHSSNSYSKFIAYCTEEDTELLINRVIKNKNYLVLIGPEGDFTEGEIRMAVDSGFIPISLGKQRLRTETAGTAVCTIINQLNL